jgi:hypothetical protein
MGAAAAGFAVLGGSAVACSASSKSKSNSKAIIATSKEYTLMQKCAAEALGTGKKSGFVLDAGPLTTFFRLV